MLGWRHPPAVQALTVCKFTNTYCGVAKQPGQKETQPHLPQSKFQARSTAASLQALRHGGACLSSEGVCPNLNSSMIKVCLGSSSIRFCHLLLIWVQMYLRLKNNYSPFHNTQEFGFVALRGSLEKSKWQIFLVLDQISANIEIRFLDQGDCEKWIQISLEHCVGELIYFFFSLKPPLQANLIP